MKINPQLKEDLKKHLSEELEKVKEKVIIYSPYVLEKGEVDSIINCFPQLKERIIENKIDPTILGGIIIQYSSKIIDLSIKSALHTFQKKLYEIN